MRPKTYRGRHIKRREAFEREVRDLLLRLGAVETPPRSWHRFKIVTRAGELGLSPHTSLEFAHEPWFHGGGSPWVAARFEDIDVARAIGLSGEINRYSGKWNHHYWHSWTEDFSEGLRLLEHRIRALLGAPPATDPNRAAKIAAGKVWHVYADAAPDNTLFEGSRSACLDYLGEQKLRGDYKRGVVRVGKVIWEPEVTQ